MSSTTPSARPEPTPPIDAEADASSEYARVRELAGLISRAPLRRRRLAAAVFLLGAIASVAAVILAPRVYVVDTKILAQRNLVMSSLGNPRRSVPSDSDAPTRAAGEAILGRESLVAIIKDADLVARWERERPPILRLKDRLAGALRAPLTDEERVRALVGVLEKKLQVQANESTIKISLEWSQPETAYRIVASAEKNFFEGRRAVEVAVIADTIGILTAEAERQREEVNSAFARVAQLRREALDAAEPPVVVAVPPSKPGSARPSAAPSAPPTTEETKIASRLDEKRRAIRAIEEPRQQRLAELEAQRARLLSTYTDAHPGVVQVDAEIKALSVEPQALLDLRKEEQELVAQLPDLASPARAPRPARAAPRPSPGPRAVAAGGAVIVNASPREDEPDLATAKAKLLVATRKYEDLMDRADSARIELHTAQAAFKYRYTVVEPPEIPREASRPNAPVLAVGGLLLSVLLAVFAAAAKDLSSGRFVEAWQVRRRLSIPVLAEVDKP